MDLIKKAECEFFKSNNTANVGNLKETSAEVISKETDMCKLLGVYWNNLSDEFTFKFDELMQLFHKLPKTKRSILRLTASLFDPLGFLSPFVITLKVMFQDLCNTRVNWDEPLSGRLKRQWEGVEKDLENLNNLRIPQCCILVDCYPTSVCLHGFSDASERAYAAVLYLSSTYADDHTEVRLLCSKARVSPTKRQTIPRLELLGAVILSRLIQSVSASLPTLNGTYMYLWTDSMTVLHWIRNKKVWKPYVQHRVNEIREFTDVDCWNYCPGKLNPSDMPSRGLGVKELVNTTLWWNGPNFIAKAKVSMPTIPDADFTIEAQTELAKSQPTLTHTLAVLELHNLTGLDKLIDPNLYSSLDSLLRITAYVLRFVDTLRKCSNLEGRDRSDLSVTAYEINKSEMVWIRAVQQSSFKGEIQFLLKPAGAHPLLVGQFALFIDDDQLVKCRGRIGNSQLPVVSKNPVLLPSKHPFVTLLIRRAHELTKHRGVNQTLTHLRENYWVLKGRQVTRNIV